MVQAELDREPYETPADHTPRWHNAMDPEQHYGILAQRAGARGASAGVGRQPRTMARSSRARAGAGRLGPLRIGQDEAYVYLALAVGPAASTGTRSTSRSCSTRTAPALGQRRLADGAIDEPIGFEFVVDLAGRPTASSESRRTTIRTPRHRAIVRGDDFGRFHRHPAGSVARDDGRFDSLYVTTNRARYGRDGTFFPAQGYNRGRLRYRARDRVHLGRLVLR